ncbi:MAG: hypothetical protein H6R02_1375 [Burkholderiaceae bacterium]|nr:hypothetical protein [Burkholderiaceae bacterium]
MRDFSHVPGDPMRQTPPGLPRSLLLCLLTTGSLGTSTPATAQMRVEAVPDSVLRPYSVRAADPTVGTLAAVRSAPKLSASAPRFRDYSWLGGAVQVEGPRETFDGRYTRPKVVVGVPSEAMKGWMNAAGVPAEQCLLPMVRARARLSPDGDANGTLWLYARCSFH